MDAGVHVKHKCVCLSNRIEKQVDATGPCWCAHPLLPLRALIHECEEVEVRRVGLSLSGLYQPANVAVDPSPRAALDQVSLVGIGAIPELLGCSPHGPPLLERTKQKKLEDLEKQQWHE